MMYIPDVRNVSTLISSFGDIVDKCWTESAVTWNVIFAMR